MSTPHKSARLPANLVARVQAIAKSKGVNFSAALRFALERGVAAMEQEANPVLPQKRKLLSRGVY